MSKRLVYGLFEVAAHSASAFEAFALLNLLVF